MQCYHLVAMVRSNKLYSLCLLIGEVSLVYPHYFFIIEEVDSDLQSSLGGAYAPLKP